MPNPRKYADKICPSCNEPFYAKPQSRTYCSRACYFAHRRAIYVARTPERTKYCRKCDSIKHFSEFYANAQQKDGRSFYCKACINAYNTEHRHKYEVQQGVYAFNWYLQKNFGITRDDFLVMHKFAEGRCEVCGSVPEKRRLSVDHCHKTGQVRGLLCSRCNSAIGYADDDPERLRKMANYLERPAAPWQLT